MQERGGNSNYSIQKPLYSWAVHSTPTLPIKQAGQPLTSGFHHIESTPHLLPQPKTFCPRPPQWTLRLQCYYNGVPRLHDSGTLKTRPLWHLVRPRRQHLVSLTRTPPLSDLPRMHCGNALGMHCRNSSVVSHQGTNDNVLINRLGYCCCA